MAIIGQIIGLIWEIINIPITVSTGISFSIWQFTLFVFLLAIAFKGLMSLVRGGKKTE